MANGTHLVEDGIDRPVGGDSLSAEVGLLLRERQGDGFRFDLCFPLPIASDIGCRSPCPLIRSLPLG